MRGRVAAEVRAVAARKRVYQRDIAKRLGMSQPALSRRWNGEIPFDVEELDAIAAFLNVPITSFLGMTATACAPSRSPFTPASKKVLASSLAA